MSINIEKEKEYLGKNYIQILTDYILRTYQFSEINEYNFEYLKKKDEEIKNHLIEYILNDKKQKFIKSLFFSGIIYFVFGVTTFIFIYLYERITFNYIIPYFMVIIGLTISLFSLVIKILNENYLIRQSNKKNSDIMIKYMELRDRLNDLTGYSINRESLKKLKLTNQDIAVILQLEKIFKMSSSETGRFDYKKFNNNLKKIITKENS